MVNTEHGLCSCLGRSPDTPGLVILVFDVLYLLFALVGGPLWLVARLVGRKPFASPWCRLGFIAGVPQEADENVIWVHGVSVGEVLAARALVKAIRERWPSARVVITSTTVTGLATARRTFPDLDVFENPYDFSFAIRRFLRRAKPRLLVLMELELWPNLLASCRRSKIPVVIANAKLSERSLLGYQRLQRLVPRFLHGVTVCAQAERYEPRFERLGLTDRTTVTGNLKYDNVTFNPDRPTRAPLRAAHGIPDDARVWIAGSTHPGEEESVLAAAGVLGRDDPLFRLVIAPRHPERVPEVLELCRRAGFEPGLRSAPDPEGDPSCLVVDTMGELSDLYGLADVAFVGGTLVPVGGHNLLEPAGWGLPLVVGAHLHTVRDSADDLEAAGALHVVREPEDLASTIARILGDGPGMAAAADGTREVITRHQGSAWRTISVLAGLLPGEGSGPVQE